MAARPAFSCGPHATPTARTCSGSRSLRPGWPTAKRRSRYLMWPVRRVSRILSRTVVATTAQHWTWRLAPTARTLAPMNCVTSGATHSLIPASAPCITRGCWKTQPVAGQPGMPSAPARPRGRTCQRPFRSGRGRHPSGTGPPDVEWMAARSVGAGVTHAPPGICCEVSTMRQSGGLRSTRRRD